MSLGAFEANYWVRTEMGVVVYLGRRGGKLDADDMKDNFTALIRALASDYGMYLQFNPCFVPEANASVMPHVDRLGDMIVINLWLADREREIELTAEYLGLNPASQSVTMNIKAHCWQLNAPAHIVDVDIVAAFMVNSFRNKEQSFKDDNLIRFIMYKDCIHDAPYIYGYFRPIESVTICKEKLSKVPKDEYALEICNLYQGYYFAIKKDKYHSDQQVTASDLTLL